ncbi:unnamed protein product [Adineta ricciae]|uniref:Uncharacterized protein n=1 Tax=Adineta ricciae TaxID=249248 RepID=A0A813VL42_ADIRI|nr:unnamed protein product [Adineta ricciae]
MVSNRCIFVLATLLLAMALTISSAPVDDDKEKFHETTEKSFDQTEKTTGIPIEDGKKLLFKDVQDNSSPATEAAK